MLDVIRDRSQRAGMRRSHVERFDVVIAAGALVVPGTRYLDGVPEGGANVEQLSAAATAAPLPADVAEARSAGNPFAALRRN